MTNLLEVNGARPQKEPRYVPLFMDKQFTGLYTQRSVLHDPSDIATARFYGGRPDALWAGSNIELTNLLTLQRRPGLIPFSGAIYPTTPDRCFSFQTALGQIQVIVDTGETPTFTLTEVTGVVAGVSATYVGTITGGDFAPIQFPDGAFVGLIFNIEGFDIGPNNGAFVCISSTGSELVLANANLGAANETHAGTAVSAGAVWYDTQSQLSTVPPVFLFAKSPGAGQTNFVAVDGDLYMGDGVDTRVYTPNGPNGQIWDWGIEAPTQQPSVVIVPSGAAATSWVAATVFSTMGFIVDPNGNTQQLFSVNALGTNSTQLGITGNGQPAFNLTGGTTIDGTVVWTDQGVITLWQGNTEYDPGQPIYDPTTNCIFIMSHTTIRQSGATKPAFNSTLGLSGARIDDTNSAGVGGGNARWECLGVVNGSPTAVLTWTPGMTFNVYQSPAGGSDPSNVNSAIVFPLIPTAANINGSQPIHLLGATTGGVSSTTPYTPWTGIPSQIAGDVTGPDGDISWLCLGSATWTADTVYDEWSTSGGVFSAIEDTNGNMQVCTVTGSSGSTAPTWQTNYGAITQDGGVQWTCVGQAMSWAAATQWFLPTVGFAPPTIANPFGGAEVIGSAFVQSVIQSGKSGASEPSWSTTIGDLTTDGTTPQITWECVAPQTVFSLSWTKGYVYAYSYESRLTDDFYNTTPPPGWPKALGTPTGSELGDISTASPVFTIVGSNNGAVNTISGIGSLNPAVDTIVIWRSADGGGADNMFYLTEIPAPQPIGGVAQPWTFKDYLPDLPTAVFPGLNDLIPAPIDDQNDPPPSTFLPMVYNFERIWGANGAQVIWSGGPDIIVGQGNPNSAFNPADEFPYLATVTRVVKTSQGLVVMLTDSIEIIAGGPLTSSFYPLTLAPGIGLLDYNALDVYMGEIYFFSSDGQVKSVSPSLNAPNFGFALGDKFAVMDPTQVYIAVQQSGVDNCIMVADGSTGWYRCNPHQIPGGANGPEPIWSPFANITNGCKMVESVEISAGIKKLLVGATVGGTQILQRDLNTFTDNGTMYDANFTMGSIMLAHPGQIAVLKFLEMDMSGVAFRPTVSFLLNEIAGTFTPMAKIPVFDPPSLYGTTITPTSYSPNRYYFASTGTLARCRHLQINVDFGLTPNPDAIYNLTIFGRLFVEF